MNPQALPDPQRLLLLDGAPAVIRTVSGECLYCTSAWRRLYGWSNEEILGKSVHECLQSEFPEALEAITARLLRDGQWSGTLKQHTRDGSTVHVAAHWALSEDGTIVETSVDITARAAHEDKAQQAMRAYQTLADNSPDIIARFDRNLRHLYVSPSISSATGRRAEEFIGKTNAELGMPADLVEFWNTLLRRVFETGQREQYEFSFDGPNGTQHFNAVLVPEFSEGGSVETVLNISRFVTDIKHAEDAVRRSERQARARLAEIEAIYESAPIGLCALDDQFRWMRANRAIAEMNGAPLEEHIGKTPWELLPDLAEQAQKALRQVLESGQPLIDFEISGITPAQPGVLRYWKESWAPIRDESGRAVGVSVAAEEITERKQAEEKLRESERRERARAAELQAIMDAVPLATFICYDPDCRTITGNRLTYELLRLPPGSNVSKSAEGGDAPQSFRAMKGDVEIPAADLPLQRAARTRKAVRDYDFELAFDDGSRRHLLGHAVPLLDENGESRGAVGAFIDITDREQLQQQLWRAQQHESIGVLAGGLAHDFNNLLVGVLGYASLVREILPSDHAVQEYLASIVDSAERAAHLTSQILAYSGRGRFVVEPVDLAVVVGEAFGLLRSSVSTKIGVHCDLKHGVAVVRGDRTQLQQVVTSLMFNAAEAIGDHAGTITLRTGERRIEGKSANRHADQPELAEGLYAWVEVADTGCGMDAATRERMFEPFFTTKFTGRGLGLSAAAGIVRGHKGAIEVVTAPGKGSTFTVLLPAERREAARPRAEPPARTGTVMVVDDEETVRQMATRSLERHGYTVLPANSGSGAVQLLRDHVSEVGLVILDLSMPGMSGAETLPALLALQPDLRVLVSSGYDEADTLNQFRGLRVSGFLQKPYTVQQLAAKVKAVWSA